MVDVFEGRYSEFARKIGLTHEHMPWVVKWQYTTLTLGIAPMRKRYEAIKEEVRQEILAKLTPEQLGNAKFMKVVMKQVPHIALARLSAQCAATEPRMERILQFLYEKPEKSVKGVATPQHLPFTAEDVSDAIGRIVEHMGIKETFLFRNYQASRLDVRDVMSEKIGGMKVGAAIRFGHELLQRAVRGSIFIEVQSCLNELHFLELRKTRLWDWRGLEVAYTRVLRVQKRTELDFRLREMIKELADVAEKFAVTMELTKTVKLTMKEADAIVSAVVYAYSLGKAVTEEIAHQFLNSDRTIWDLAMAFTNAAKHEELFKERGERSQARVSSAGTVLLAMPKDKLVKNCTKFMRVNKKVQKVKLEDMVKVEVHK